MSDLRAGLGRQGARRDRPFAGQPPPAVVAAVAFAALLAGAAQVAVQRAPGLLLGPDVAIDRFVTDREPVKAAQPRRHLFGTPIFPQQLLDLRPRRGSELAIAPGARAAGARVPVGELGPIAPVAGHAVAPDLAANRAAVAAEHTRDRGRSEAPLAQQPQRVSFGSGDLVIRQHRLRSLAGEG